MPAAFIISRYGDDRPSHSKINFSKELSTRSKWSSWSWCSTNLKTASNPLRIKKKLLLFLEIFMKKDKKAKNQAKYKIISFRWWILWKTHSAKNGRSIFCKVANNRCATYTISLQAFTKCYQYTAPWNFFKFFGGLHCIWRYGETQGVQEVQKNTFGKYSTEGIPR